MKVPILCKKETTPATLHLFLVNGKELCWLFHCAVCGLPITEFDDANLMFDGTAKSCGPAEKVGGNSLEPLAGQVFAVHKACDDRRRHPWVPLSCVLRSDQRSSRDIRVK